MKGQSTIYTCTIYTTYIYYLYYSIYTICINFVILKCAYLESNFTLNKNGIKKWFTVVYG